MRIWISLHEAKIEILDSLYYDNPTYLACALYKFQRGSLTQQFSGVGKYLYEKIF